MCGKTFERFARSTVTQAEYKDRASKRATRRMLVGANRFPKYPPVSYKPESKLFGMQGVGELESNSNNVL